MRDVSHLLVDHISYTLCCRDSLTVGLFFLGIQPIFLAAGIECALRLSGECFSRIFGFLRSPTVFQNSFARLSRRPSSQQVCLILMPKRVSEVPNAWWGRNITSKTLKILRDELGSNKGSTLVAEHFGPR